MSKRTQSIMKTKKALNIYQVPYVTPVDSPAGASPPCLHDPVIATSGIKPSRFLEK